MTLPYGGKCDCCGETAALKKDSETGDKLCKSCWASGCRPSYGEIQH